MTSATRLLPNAFRAPCAGCSRTVYPRAGVRRMGTSIVQCRRCAGLEVLYFFRYVVQEGPVPPALSLCAQPVAVETKLPVEDRMAIVEAPTGGLYLAVSGRHTTYIPLASYELREV